jgi:hypothetical protein
MSNLTITVDEATLKKARLRALTEGISVNEVLRKFLESYEVSAPSKPQRWTTSWTCHAE